MPVKELIEELRTHIRNRDFFGFETSYFRLREVCVKNLIEANRPVLKELEKELPPLLLWFYGKGKPEWDKASHPMAKVEMLEEFIEDFLDSPTQEELNSELAVDLQKSAVDRDILRTLLSEKLGITSGEIARRMEKNPNTITNRLPGLEKRGLVVRARRGKNSIVHLTPLGREAVEVCCGERKEPVRHAKEAPLEGETYKDLYGRDKAQNDPLTFFGVTKNQKGDSLSATLH